MDIFCRLVAKRFQIIALEDIEHLQHRYPLGVWWKLIHIISTVVGPYGVNPIRMMLLHVFHGKYTTTALHIFCNTASQRAAIKGIAPTSGKHPVRTCKIWLPQDFSGLERLTIRQKDSRTALP